MSDKPNRLFTSKKKTEPDFYIRMSDELRECCQILEQNAEELHELVKQFVMEFDAEEVRDLLLESMDEYDPSKAFIGMNIISLWTSMPYDSLMRGRLPPPPQ
jgi:hypothetical protein